MEVEPDKKNQMSKQGTDYIDTDLPHDRPTVPQNQSFLGSIMEGTPSNFFLQKVGFVTTYGEGVVSQYLLFSPKLHFYFSVC